jgi:DNA-binding PadR family transcriptional regulator
MGKQGLGEFELLVLLAVLRLGEDQAHAVSIVDEIRARTGRDARRSAVYVTLQRLETKGLVSTRMGDPTPERGGKGRRLVRIEPEGLAGVRATQAALRNMWGDLAPLLPADR